MLDLIRKQISDVAAKPGSEAALRGRLEQLAGHQGQTLSDDGLALLIRHLHAYVESTPDLLEASLSAADDAGLGEALKPIVKTAGDYFLEQEDYIPDDWGLLGLLDDAYLVHCLLDRVSHHHQEQTGVPLLPVSLAGATQVVRWIIGEPIIGQLDRTVAATLRSARVSQQLQRLARRHKTLSFGDASPRTWGAEWKDEMARIADKCGISVDV